MVVSVGYLEDIKLVVLGKNKQITLKIWCLALSSNRRRYHWANSLLTVYLQDISRQSYAFCGPAGQNNQQIEPSFSITGRGRGFSAKQLMSLKIVKSTGADEIPAKTVRLATGQTTTTLFNLLISFTGIHSPHDIAELLQT